MEIVFGLLGPLVVRCGGAELPALPGKQRVVLAALLLQAGRVVALDELTDTLWEAAPPPSARITIQNYVKRLRQRLGDEGGQRLITRPPGYLIRVDTCELDVIQFQASVRAARAAARDRSWGTAAGHASEALALWRGEPLADVESEALRRAWAFGLTEMRIQALETRIDADLHLGRHADVITEVRHLVSAHPLREHLHAQLMLALYRDGRQAEALDAYQDARKLLAQELGADPGPGLRQLHQQILTSDPQLAVAEPALALAGGRPTLPRGLPAPEPAPPVLAVRYSLPPDTAAFTGRAEQLDLISTAGTAAAGEGGGAVYAIDGMPGLGKTALAVHIAHRLGHRFADRQLFIDLHAHTPGQEPVSAEAALAGLLTATGVDARNLPGDLEGRAGLWRDRMAGQRAVLVLDNAASSDQVAPLLPGGAGCLVLVTSRRHLGDLPGAAISVRLETLPPDEAQEMFLRLAPRAATSPDAAVVELVQLAGFLPLAISLLARIYARHPSWTLADLTRETKASLLTLTAEKSSVAAAFDVSYRYLAPGQQQFFRRLAVHPGTTIDPYAAGALAGIPLAEASDHLDALHGEGLLTEVGYRRYGMHDLIRQYAQRCAATDPITGRDQALARLLDYYQHTATLADGLIARQTRASPTPADPMTLPAAVPDLADRTQALSWARSERGNLLACLDHATRINQHSRIVTLTATMAALLRHDGPWAGAITRHATAVKAARHLGDRPGEAGALNELGAVHLRTGDSLAAAGELEAALGIYRDLDDQQGEANCLSNLGDVRLRTDDYPGAAAALEAALAIHRDLGDPLGEAGDLTELGVVRFLTSDFPGAAGSLEAALAIHRDLGDRAGEAGDLSYLGVVRRLTGDFPGAAASLEAALVIHRDLGDQRGEASALNDLGAVRRASGDLPGAAAVLEEALAIHRNLGNRAGQGVALGYLGSVRQLTGDFPSAAQALEEALDIFRDIGNRGGEVETLNEMGTLHRVRGALNLAMASHQHALDVARQIGSPWDEAHALAGLGRCALAAGHPGNAEARLRQAREIFQRLGAAEASDLAAELDALSEPGPTAQRS